MILAATLILWPFRPAVVPQQLASRPARPASRPALSAADLTQLTLDVARLEGQAELHDQTARRIASREARAARHAELAAASTEAADHPSAADPADAITAEVERAALILLRRGEQWLAEPGARAQATDALRRIVDQFPQTRGAAGARIRLEQLGA